MILLKFNRFLSLKLLDEVKMARIIESTNGNRRVIRMSTDDIISIVRDYQRIVPRFSTIEDARNYLSDAVIFIPEDV